MTETTQELLTPDEVARYLRVAPQTVYRLLRCGECPGVKVGRQWRVRRSDLEACLTNPAPGAAPAAPRAEAAPTDQAA